uniref:Uncharacterized protein n=1 Tax=Amphimedon queenslandica TaxID=400682 RepID=A0A1X7SM67_AMPQE
MIVLINEERSVTGSLRSQVSRLEDIVHKSDDQIREELVVMKQMFEQSEESRATMSVEIARLSSQNTHLLKESETLSSNMEKVSQKAGTIAMTNANLQSKLDEAQSKIQSLQQEMIKLQEKSGEQEVRNERLAVQLQQRPEADDVKAMQSQLSSLHIVMEQNSSEHELTVHKLNEEINKLKSDKERLEGDLKKMTDHIQTAPQVQDMTKLELQLSSLTSELERVKNEKELLTNQLESLQEKFSQYISPETLQ